jgi:hypothetical protein
VQPGDLSKITSVALARPIIIIKPATRANLKAERISTQLIEVV